MSDAFEQLGVGREGIGPWRAFVDAHRGRLDAVRETVGDSPPSEPIIAMIRSRCLGLAELANGETEAANVHLSEAIETLERVDFREPAIWRVDGDAIEAALGVGELERAERLAARFQECAERSKIPWSLAVSARCRALLEAAAGDLEAAARSLERALAAQEDSPVPFELARTLLVQGQVLRRLKQKRRPTSRSTRRRRSSRSSARRRGWSGQRPSFAASLFAMRRAISARPSCASRGWPPTALRIRRSRTRSSSRARVSRQTSRAPTAS